MTEPMPQRISDRHEAGEPARQQERLCWVSDATGPWRDRRRDKHHQREDRITMTNQTFDWDAVERQQQADTEMEHGFPLLVSDWRHQWRVAREEYGSSREDQLRNIVQLREFVVDVRPGSLTTDQLLALFNEEWPER